MLEGSVSKKYHKICTKLLGRFGGKLIEDISPDNIICIKTTGGEKLRWWGRIHRITFPYSVFVDYSYIIEVNVDKVAEACETKLQRKNMTIATLFHELRHIMDDGTLRRHDVEDFYMLLKIVGVERDYPNSPNLLRMSNADIAKCLGRKERRIEKR